MAGSTLGEKEKERERHKSFWVMSRTQFSALLKLTLGGPANLNGECTLPAGSSVISKTSRFTVYACYLLFLKGKIIISSSITGLFNHKKAYYFDSFDIFNGFILRL